MELTTQPNIVLAGFMGTGKTAVGKLLAKRLNRRFVDTDDLIEKDVGMAISRIFSEQGEPHFRELERSVLAGLKQPEGLVVAIGGGAVLDPANVRHLKQGGVVVCLQARAETLLARLAATTNRPLLEAGERKAEILRLLSERQEAYASLPFQVVTDGLTLQEVADRVLDVYATDSKPGA